MQDKSVLVTGAAGGVGKAIARRFAEQGASVLVTDIDARAAGQVAEAIGGQGRARAATLDVGDAASIEFAVASIVGWTGRLDVVVHAAGMWAGGTVLDIDEARWTRVLEVNTTSAYLIARHCVPHLRQTRGSIINIASVAGLKGTPGAVAYNSSKSAVVGMTKCMALDFAASGVRVNCICPGVIDTPMVDAVLAHHGEAFTREDLARRHPLGRLGTPEDIAGAASFLASDDASWITGTALVVDGGSMAGV
ncbi:short-chain dehydrogenase [Sphingobium sp. TA15]|uniref:SDR-family protein n=2 Tax=Sphingobium indicum TaxID=332055 RepID=D4Z716_SPHIU|nr:MULTISPECIES: SDR family NAD(P)-dependent oxidoreductase [Sphingobium]EPR12443.1 SDR-family protein [Sphingobium indicum IP26]BDD68918.1 short-chain dehydrogenase [Sphingobium sp. TA15]EQB08480.1 SDR-family protein [Sphingobium sp. HDIP04]KER34420.1 3-oxoacyl-ACP reductase [Sphingobium indicum F2]BAI98874.1 SDR-family protein [Sphingobium indicum UT26S]